MPAAWLLLASQRKAAREQLASGPGQKSCNEFEDGVCWREGPASARRSSHAWPETSPLDRPGCGPPHPGSRRPQPTLAWFQVQHARIVLAVAAGERIRHMACRLECDRATVWRVCRRYEQGGLKRSCWTTPVVGRPQEISPLQHGPDRRTGLPGADRRGLAHHPLDQRDLARQAVADGIVDSHQARTVRRILHDVDLQPHRTRYWRTTRLDARFKERAEKVLWCYGNAERLARQGIWTVAVDEMPNIQVLERRPIRRAIPGSIEQQEFEYVRHGTVNLLLFLVVHTRADGGGGGGQEGRGALHPGVAGVPPAAPGSEGGVPDSGQRPQPHGGGHGGVLVWVRGLVAAPLHAGPRLVAEPGGVAGRGFGYHYLKRGSWAGREEFIEHVLASGPEYNQRYAHPFEWTWTNQKMRGWFAARA